MSATQGDLFASDEDQGPPPGSSERLPWGQIHPNPLDGLIHLVKEVSTERGARVIVVKCGAKMPTYRSHERLAGADIFGCRVTCEACLR